MNCSYSEKKKLKTKTSNYIGEYPAEEKHMGATQDMAWTVYTNTSTHNLDYGLTAMIQ